MRKSMCVCMAGLAVAIAGVADVRTEPPEGIELTRDGQPAAVIVLATNATRAARFAAAELQWHVEKITGATLPIEEAARGEWQGATGRTPILVGESPVTEALGLRGSDFRPQEYLIGFRPIGPSGPICLILMGRDKEDRAAFDYANPHTFPNLYDEQGTSYAVHDFLERGCGVRWYLPTDLGIVHPLTPSLVVPAIEVRRAPAVKTRHQSVGYQFPADLHGDTIRGPEPTPVLAWREQMLWYLRHRLGGEPHAVNHSLYGYFDRFYKPNPARPALFEAERPEWFAQGYGEQRPTQLCYSHTGLVSQVVQDARDYFDGKGVKHGAQAAGDYFAVVPMDTAGWCRCETCQTRIGKEASRGKGQFSNDRVSDYLLGFVNRVAREVAPSHPDKFIATIAYWDYAYPPAGEPMEPNVAVNLCLHARMIYSPSIQANDRDIFDAWLREAGPNRKGFWFYYCFPSLNAVSSQFRCFPGFFGHALVRALNAYLRHDIRIFSYEPSYMAFERRSPLLDQVEFYVTWKLADDPRLDGDALIAEFFRLYYGQAEAPMRDFYEKVEAIYADPANYPPDAGHQTEEIAWRYLGTAERMEALGRLMEQARAAAQTEVEKQRVDLFDRGVWQYMVRGREAYLEHAKQKAGARRQIRVPRAPAADGDLSQADWSRGAMLDGWRTLLGEATERSIEGRILHDGRFLYLQLQEDLDTSKLIFKGNSIWSEDEYELFFARQRAKPYRQMGVNANGVHEDLAWGEAETKWASGATVVSDITTPDRWTLRLAFPLAMLLPGGVQPGEVFYLNVLRATDMKQTLAWVPTFAGFHEPSAFGEVVLEP